MWFVALQWSFVKGVSVTDQSAIVGIGGSSVREEGFSSRMVDLILAGLFLPFALAALAVLWVAHQLFHRSGGSFLYRGVRLGKNADPFVMYKVRTLALGVEEWIGSEILQAETGRELPLGRFLRNTRLDEIPQIFNIFRGDMALVGPRPIRPAVYRRVRGTIPDYDYRFLVRPGLVGYAQVFTPHAAPKRMRSLIDNRYIRKRKGVASDIGVTILTLFWICRRIVREAWRIGRNHLALLFHRRARDDQRLLSRIRAPRVSVFVSNGSFDARDRTSAKLADINGEAIRLETEREFEVGQEIHLVLISPNGKESRTKRAKCTARIWRKSPKTGRTGGSWSYVAFYDPISPLNRYMVNQYILKDSVFKA